LQYGEKEMSEKIKQARLEKMKHDVARALTFSLIIMGLAIFTYVVASISPHVGAANDVWVVVQWQYGRDIMAFGLAVVSGTVFFGLFFYWFFQDEKLQRKQKKELIRETIKEVLKEEKQK